MESIVVPLPVEFESDDGELDAPPCEDGHTQRRRRSLMEIPMELQSEIFVRMPVKSILLCKCVCKQFRNIIQNPNFIQTHFSRINLISDNTQSLILAFGFGPDKRYIQWDHFLLSIDYTTKDVLSSLHFTPPIPYVGWPDQFHFVGSCNGLICVLVWYNNDWTDFSFIIWNPVIKQCRYLPKSQCTRIPDVIEFGYDAETNDYIVIKVNFESEFYVEVYKMSIDSWIMIKCSILAGEDFILEKFKEITSVFLNGSFHWAFSRDGCTYVLYYKITDEKLDVMKGVDDDNTFNSNGLNDHYRYGICWTLAVVHESLALIFWNNKVGNKLEVWVMNEYGVEDSWAIRYQIVDDISLCLYPEGYWTNGNLLMIDEMEGLQLYDLNTRKRKNIPKMDTDGVLTTFCSFVETLVPVNPQVDGGNSSIFAKSSW